MEVKVNIINAWCIPVTEAVTVMSNLVAIASLVFEILLAEYERLTFFLFSFFAISSQSLRKS